MKQLFLDKLREVVNNMEYILVASTPLWNRPMLQRMPMIMVRSCLGSVQHCYSYNSVAIVHASIHQIYTENL